MGKKGWDGCFPSVNTAASLAERNLWLFMTQAFPKGMPKAQLELINQQNGNKQLQMTQNKALPDLGFYPKGMPMAYADIL